MRTKFNGVVLGSDSVLEGNHSLTVAEQPSVSSVPADSDHILMAKAGDEVSKTTGVTQNFTGT